MQAMQRIEGLARKALQSWQMVQPGDSLCIALSGGKDSVVLAVALANLRHYHDIPYTLHALTLDPCFFGRETDYTPLTELLTTYHIPHTLLRTNIGPVVFDARKEQNPCALCAKLRRGTLHTQAKKLGCNKIVMGHHLDDAVETFYMNLFANGEISCFSPRSWLSRKELTLIRPLVFCRESEITRAAGEALLPITKNPCPVEGETYRAQIKRFVEARCQADPAFRQKTLGALQKADVDGWAPLQGKPSG